MSIILPSASVFSKADILPKAIAGTPTRAMVFLTKEERALFDFYIIHNVRGITGEVLGTELGRRGINIHQLVSNAMEAIEIGEKPTDREITAVIAQITASLAAIGGEVSMAVREILLDPSFHPIPESSNENANKGN